jgi:CheY-like chemotaxis protein
MTCEAKARRKTILVVDDFEEMRALVRKALEKDGHLVVEAADGVEAVALAQSVLPDLILMDLSMPTLDGFAAVHRIRRLYGLGHVPIIALSAHAAREVRDDALAAGFCDYLVKPVDIFSLAEAVARHMRRDVQGDS